VPTSPPTNRGRRFDPDLLTPDEARRLLRAPSSRAPTGIRNRALLTVMYRAGLRLAEALHLKPGDIDYDAGVVHVLNGKGAKRRVVPLDDGALAVIQRWADVRAARGINGRAPLFCTLDGKPLSPRYVRQMMQRYAERAGLDKRVHPHGLRHSFAAELQRQGVSMRAIQEALGHANLATTGAYLSRIAPGELAGQVRQAMAGWTL
jgi:site-specific recombinase XerD